MDGEGNMFKGFKEFITRGNVIELAVGVIIGGLFNAIVTALVNGIINPIIAALFGQPNFDSVLAFTLNGSQIRVGVVITAIVNFLLTAAALYFLIVLPFNRLNARRLANQPAPEPEADVALLTEIRDLMREQVYPGSLAEADQAVAEPVADPVTRSMTATILDPLKKAGSRLRRSDSPQ
ncbi:MAG: large conductance mechanosensitive channel protein MscL [Propionibacteriaceae bacterium]|nr:large conductance mechanosensitive channel protein MscL [Propionibacteriaceae bacterium]